MITARDYQEHGVQMLRESIEAGNSRVLAVAATGAGKTILACLLILAALEKGHPSLFVAPRREIIAQTYRKLIDAGLRHEDVGVILAGVEDGARGAAADDPWRLAARRPWAKVQVASIDTLRNRAKPPAGLVFLDEAHRSISPSYEKLVAEYPEANIIGLTATPWRADGKAFRTLYEDIVVIASPKTLIERGYLVGPRVWTVPKGSLPDLSGVKIKGGDYDDRELAAACDKAALVGDIVEHWQKHASGQRTVVFAASVEHSKHIVERFVAAGITAEHLDGETDVVTRSAILGRLRRGETLIVSNCAVLCEGWDEPIVSCCILARPTKSTTLYIQCAGRILRPHPEKGGAIILDHAGCAIEHGLPHEDREYSLDPPKKRRGSREDCAKACPDCLEVVELGTLVCPHCGHEFPAREKKPIEEGKGELVEVLTKSVAATSLAKWEALVEKWRLENEKRMATPTGRPRKAGWLRHEWKNKHGFDVPRGAKMPKNTPEELARIAELDEKAKPATGPLEVAWGAPDADGWSTGTVKAAAPTPPAMRRVAW